MSDINNLIYQNEKLIYKIISKYKNYFEIEDLYQVAVMGLIKASKNYKNDSDAKFITYAYPYILGEVVKYVNEYRDVKVKKEFRIIYSKIMQAKEVLSQKLMKEPSLKELSLFLELDEKELDEIISANLKSYSLDKVLDEDNQNFELYDKYGYIDQNIENYPLASELNKLSHREREIIIDRYYNDMSQKEIGDKLGMYQVEVSRTEKKILKKLRQGISA